MSTKKPDTEGRARRDAERARNEASRAALRARQAAEQAAEQAARRARREAKAEADRAAAIAEACAAAGQADRAADFIRRGLTLDQVKAQLGHLETLGRMMRAAKRQAPRADFSAAEALIRTASPVADVAAALQEAAVTADEAVGDVNSSRISTREAAARTNNGWNTVIAKQQQSGALPR